MVRRLAMAAVAVGALIAAGVLLANVGPRPTATLASGSSSFNMAAHQLANGAGSTTPGRSGRFGSRLGTSGRFGSRLGASSRFGWGFGGRQRHVGFGRVLAVTGVSGNTNTITATGRGGQTITVNVSATTAYTEAGASASLADIHPGSV